MNIMLKAKLDSVEKRIVELNKEKKEIQDILHSETRRLATLLHTHFNNHYSVDDCEWENQTWEEAEKEDGTWGEKKSWLIDTRNLLDIVSGEKLEQIIDILSS